MHNDSTLRSEPCVQVRNTRDSVAFLHKCIATCFQQVLIHVALEVGQQLHLLFELWRIGSLSEVSLLALLVDEVDIAVEKKKFLE